jgi:hypothetical protein
MHTIDKIPVEKIVEQIQEVGPENVVVSSDVGQTFSPSPSKTLTKFAEALISSGLTIKDIDRTFRINPQKITRTYEPR